MQIEGEKRKGIKEEARGDSGEQKDDRKNLTLKKGGPVERTVVVSRRW